MIKIEGVLAREEASQGHSWTVLEKGIGSKRVSLCMTAVSWDTMTCRTLHVVVSLRGGGLHLH